MATYHFDKEFDRKLRSLAEQHNRTPEEYLAGLVEAQYSASNQPYPRVTPPDLPPRPASSLTDDDIELHDWVREEDKEKFREAERAIRPKLYRIARRYWQQVGDAERLALTDEELDKQFWFIDREGVPRLKSEKGKVERPTNSLLEMAKKAYLDSERGTLGTRDVSSRSREILQTEFPRYLKERMDRDAD